MASFTYTAMMADGKEKKGTLDAIDKNEAIAMIKAEGGIPMTVVDANAFNREINLSFSGRGGVKARDLSIFCRQFVSILRSGVSIVQALDMLSQQTENKKLQASLMNVKDNVEKGETLSVAMKREGNRIYPKLLVSMVEAGEASGSLEIAIERMAIQFEKDARIKSMVKKAFMYPCVLLVVMIAVVILMVTVIVPNFVGMFADMDAELPLITKMVVGLSDAFINNWYVILAAVVAIAVGFTMFKNTNQGAHILANITLKIPVINKLVIKTACARFSRTLQTLLAAGMSMMDALEICSGTMDNILFKEALLDVRTQVALGSSLAEQLEYTRLFPPMVYHMVGIGEETGNLDNMLSSIADYYDEEVEAATQQVTALMEPMIILLMGVVVGTLVLSIYMPIISMYDSLG